MTGSQKKSGPEMAPVSELLVTSVMLMVSLAFALVYSLIASFKTFIPRRFRRYDITGKVALVTGGGSGIGRLLMIRLARNGAKVISWDVNEKGNAETVRLVKAEGNDCMAATVDLCDRHAIYKAADELKKQGIKVDILVNNAGIVTGKNFLESPDEMVTKTFDVNILSHFWTAKAFLPSMLSSNSGHVVTIASMAGKIGTNKLVDYCASKFAAVGFDESLRTELMVNNNDGVFTTVVCPYYINTGMFDGVKSRFLPILDPEYVADEITEAILLRKLELVLPKGLNFFVIMKQILTWPMYFRLGKILEANCSMDHFAGRNAGGAKKKN